MVRKMNVRISDLCHHDAIFTKKTHCTFEKILLTTQLPFQGKGIPTHVICRSLVRRVVYLRACLTRALDVDVNVNVNVDMNVDINVYTRGANILMIVTLAGHISWSVILDWLAGCVLALYIRPRHSQRNAMQRNATRLSLSPLMIILQLGQDN